MSPTTSAPPRWHAGLGVSGYEYGNTRLRARRGELLGRDQLRELAAAGSPERLLGALRSTAYGPDVERALVHKHVLHRVDVAVRDHLGRHLNDVRSFYSGRPLDGVELLLGRWDLTNLLAIIRAAATPGRRVELTPLLIPAGVLDRTALIELERQPSLRSVIDLMVAWDLPSRETARKLPAAWRRSSAESGDPAALEEIIAGAWAGSIAAGLERWQGTDLEHALRSEIDRSNVLIALRRRADGIDHAHSVDPAGPTLPGGTIPDAALAEAQRSHRADSAAATIGRYRSQWSQALERWVRDDDLSALDGRLRRHLAQWAIGRFVHGDPLGIAIPLAFVWAKESEAANVRLIGRAVIHRLEWDEIEGDLVP